MLGIESLKFKISHFLNSSAILNASARDYTVVVAKIIRGNTTNETRGLVPKFATGLICQNGHSSKSI